MVKRGPHDAQLVNGYACRRPPGVAISSRQGPHGAMSGGMAGEAVRAPGDVALARIENVGVP